MLARALFPRLFALVSKREINVLANEKCFTVVKHKCVRYYLCLLLSLVSWEMFIVHLVHACLSLVKMSPNRKYRETESKDDPSMEFCDI